MKKSLSHHDQQREREKQRLERRLAWMKQQEEEREHERRKRKKIEEYERKRAEQLKSSHRNKTRRKTSTRSRSRSRSGESCRTSHPQPTHNSRSRVMSEKLNATDNYKPLFQGPGVVQKYNESELRKVIVKIDRKIPEAVAGPSDIRRDILNPEEITLKRREGQKLDQTIRDVLKIKKPQPRKLEDCYHVIKGKTRSLEGEQLNELIRVLLTKKPADLEVGDTKMELDVDGNNNGEGLKPIFDREELKSKPLEIEEHRTIQAVGRDSPVKRSQPKRRSVSLSPRRHRSPSSSRSSSLRMRSVGSYRYHSDDYHHKYDRRRSRSRENGREESRRRRTSRGRSHSRDRDYLRSDREYSRKIRSEKEYRERRDRSVDASYEREREEASKERQMIPASYVQQLPYPVYYQGYPARPMLIGPPLPPMPARGPVIRARIPMVPIRPPFPPRFVGPQEIYRNSLPPDPRYRPTY